MLFEVKIGFFLAASSKPQVPRIRYEFGWGVQNESNHGQPTAHLAAVSLPFQRNCKTPGLAAVHGNGERFFCIETSAAFGVPCTGDDGGKSNT